MITDGRLAVSVEPVPTRIEGDQNALCTLEFNEDGRLVRCAIRRLPPRYETRAFREAAEMASRAVALFHSLGEIGRAVDVAQAQGLPADQVDFLRQLAALEDLRGDEARARLGALWRRPGVA